MYAFIQTAQLNKVLDFFSFFFDIKKVLTSGSQYVYKYPTRMLGINCEQAIARK